MDPEQYKITVTLSQLENIVSFCKDYICHIPCPVINMMTSQLQHSQFVSFYKDYICHIPYPVINMMTSQLQSLDMQQARLTVKLFFDNLTEIFSLLIVSFDQTIK